MIDYEPSEIIFGSIIFILSLLVIYHIYDFDRIRRKYDKEDAERWAKFRRSMRKKGDVE